MQNAKCKACGERTARPLILHSAFCILHFGPTLPTDSRGALDGRSAPAARACRTRWRASLRRECRMQNAKCKIDEEPGVGLVILHSAFCILHFGPTLPTDSRGALDGRSAPAARACRTRCRRQAWCKA